MSNTILLQDWLRAVDDEYLSSFIKYGGSSIKFAVAGDEIRQNLNQALKNRCRELDYLFINLDAIMRRFHMPQDLFFGVAAQIDWRLLARRQLLRLADIRSYKVDGVDPGQANGLFIDIAQANWTEPEAVFRDIRPEIQEKIVKNAKLTKDFRVAMSHLCVREYTRPGEEYTAQPVLDWLTGASTRVSNVRNFSIHTRIDRTTARYFLESALCWVRDVGYAGTVIMLDNSRVTLASNPRDGNRYYTKAMAMDHYELLREFIDDVDRLLGTLLVVATNYDFLDETRAFRGYGIYPALRTRVMDDVRDRNLVNPVASLVRLSEGSPQDDDST